MRLKNKFMLAFTPLFVIALTIYSVIAINLYIEDKIAFVFSANQDGSSMASTLTENLYQAQAPLLETIITSFNYEAGHFSELAKSYLQLSDTVESISMLGIKNSQIQVLDSIGEKPSSEILTPIMKKGAFSSSPIEFIKDRWILQKVIDLKNSSFDSFQLAIIMRNNPVKALVTASRFYDLALADFDGNLILQPSTPTSQNSLSIMSQFVQEGLVKKDIPLSKEKNSYILTWSPIRGTKLGFVTSIKKEKAMQAIESMKRKAVGVLLILISIGLTVVLSLVSRLTKNIESLSRSLISFSSGNLEEKSNIKTRDEVGILSTHFNDMTDKIKSLIQQTEVKARMESELNTARHVQTLFLPQFDQIDSDIHIKGFIESASECGGDWWTFHKTDQGYRFLIADVTGHGVAPAILTAALNAGCEALKDFKNLALNEYVSHLNAVIFACSKGELQLSLFVGEVTVTENRLNYVNASHCTPLMVNSQGDVQVLDEISGPHLGRQIDSAYKMHEIPFHPSEIIFTYTDGLVEFSNSANRLYGEKRLYKLLQKNSGALLKREQDLRELVKEDFMDFRSDQELTDDVTFVVVSRSL